MTLALAGRRPVRSAADDDFKIFKLVKKVPEAME